MTVSIREKRAENIMEQKARGAWSLPVREPAQSEQDHALWAALWNKDAQGLAEAIESGANPWASSVEFSAKDDVTPLMAAGWMRWVDGLRALAPYGGAKLRSNQGRDAARWVMEGGSGAGDVGGCLDVLWRMGGQASWARDGSALTAAIRGGVGREGAAAMSRSDFEELLARSEPNEALDDGADALMAAASCAAPDWTVECLAKKCDPLAVDAQGCSALMRALGAGALSTAKALIGLSDKSGLDYLGRSIWIHAAIGAAKTGQVGLLDMAEPWCENKKRDARGIGALGWAAREGFGESDEGDEVFERLLSECEPAERCSEGAPALLALMDGWRISERQMARIAKAAHKLDAKAQDDSGRDALMFAALKGWSELAAGLAGVCDKGARDVDGRTALMWAARAGREQVCRTLVCREGARMVDKDGASALSHAVSQKRWGAARELLEHSDPEGKDKNGDTPLSLAQVDAAPEAQSLAESMRAIQEQRALSEAVGQCLASGSSGKPRV
jgi:ankyrin repeat protein